jgi:hypothetical protein
MQAIAAEAALLLPLLDNTSGVAHGPDCRQRADRSSRHASSLPAPRPPQRRCVRWHRRARRYCCLSDRRSSAGSPADGIRWRVHAAFHPIGHEVSTPRETVLSDFKEVGKVRMEHDFEVEAHRREAVIGQVEVFMDTRSCRPADYEAHRISRDHPFLGREFGVGEVDACCIVGGGTGGEPDPRLPICVAGIGTHEPGVIGEETLFAVGCDLPIELRYHEGTPMINCQDGRANMNVKRHSFLLHEPRVMVFRPHLSACLRTTCGSKST